MNNKEKLIIIAGPTATGKSDAAVYMAKQLHGSVISADSMQVYRGMDIGTAKILPEQMQGVAHYLIDIIEPEEEWNVVLFQQEAMKAVREIHEKGEIPIVAGGTGFYIQSLLYAIDFTQMDTDHNLRAQLEAEAARGGADRLHQMLQSLDPEAAAQIHPNNVKRVIRAIEFASSGGGRISEHNQRQRLREPAYDAVCYVLTMDRKKLYERIDRRVGLMMQSGLVEEVRRLKDRGLDNSFVSMQGLGYRQILDALDGRYSMEEAADRIRVETRHFAKRQLTWFRREQLRNPSQVRFVDVDDFECREALHQYLTENAAAELALCR